MLSPTNRSWLEVEQVGAVTVARPTRPDLLDEMAINTMGNQLYSLVDDLECKRIVLDLGRVKRLASGMLGKIIGLHKKLQASGGRLALCKIAPPLVEAFETLRLDRLFGIYGEEQEALQSFQ